jgi:Ca-activated chloride channel homolog
MSFQWPWFLLLLGLIPLLIVLYLWNLRRRRVAVRYSSLMLVREALPQQSRLRRHLPFALFLLAAASLVIALSRPTALTRVPAGQATVILALDVSRSMLEDDIAPNRLEAAANAAVSFVQDRTTNTQIGVVAFAGFAQLIQPPTTNQSDLKAIIKTLNAGRGTAIGSAILESLDAIAKVNSHVAPSQRDFDIGNRLTPAPNPSFVPDIIVLLTDGVTTTGPDPILSARQAAERGVRVYTIGFGTDRVSNQPGSGIYGTDPSGAGSGSSPSSSYNDPQNFGWGHFRRELDEKTLREIASLTGGEYYSASSSGELQKVFASLPTYLITREETMEISVGFAALGALLAAMAVVFSLMWHPLP